MNSMMLIGTPILRRTGLPPLLLTLAFDASAARGSNDSRVHGAGGQHHPIARAQLDPFSLALDDERDRGFSALRARFVGMAVRRAPVVRTVRPRVTRPRLTLQGRH